LSIDTLLLNSSVCGTGIDTVPVPGDATARQLAGLFCDVSSMATRLSKPLSVRVWPALGRRAGERVHFSCPFFVDSAVLRLDPPTQRERTTDQLAAAARTLGLFAAGAIMGAALAGRMTTRAFSG